MKNTLLLTYFLFIFSFSTFAQTDSIQYYNKDWRVSGKEDAYYYSTFKSQDDKWKRENFYAKTGSRQMVGSFLDKSRKKAEGLFRWYYENGNLKDSIIYENGERVTGWYFYENGSRKAEVRFIKGKVDEQKGWDENGRELLDYIFEKPAEFPGGMEGWRRYLERNLNAQVAADDRAPSGNYTVRLRFKVDRLGVIHNVEPIAAPRLALPV